MNSAYYSKLKRNPKLMFWAKAFYEVKLMTAMIVPFYLARGIDEAEIILLNLLFSVITVIAEVPSGYLADKVGRKKTMLLGIGLLTFSTVLMFIVQGFLLFVALFTFYALAYSCFSGTEESLLFETNRALQKEKEHNASFGRLQSARSILKMFLPSLAALLAVDRSEEEFFVIIALSVLANIMSFLLILFVTEPPLVRKTKSVLRTSWNVIRSDAVLLRLAMNKSLTFVIGLVVWQMYQPMLIHYGMGSHWWLAGFYFVMHLLNFLISRSAGYFGKRFGSRLMIQGSLLVMASSLLLIIVVQTWWIVFVGLLMVICSGTARTPHFSLYINRRIPPDVRSTTLSGLQLLRIFDIPIFLASAYLVSMDLHLMYGFLIIALLLVWKIVQVRPSDLLSS